MTSRKLYANLNLALKAMRHDALAPTERAEYKPHGVRVCSAFCQRIERHGIKGHFLHNADLTDVHFKTSSQLVLFSNSLYFLYYLVYQFAFLSISTTIQEQNHGQNCRRNERRRR